MAHIICLAQQKGGTSKTSSVWNISAALVQEGYKVLVVDMDMQANLTASLGVNPLELERSMYALLSDPTVKASDVVVETAEGIDLLPADNDLAVIEFAIKEAIGREKILAKKLRPIAGNYDFILIDTPPSFAITTLNAMSAANYLLCPVQPEPYCLDGMKNLTRTFEMIQEDSNSNLQMLGVFITMYNSRLKAHREITEVIQRDWSDLAFETVIRQRTNILESAVDNRAVVTLKPNSDLAQDYINLTKEIVRRVQ
jgi:chromosome partitioning protein